MPEIGQFFPKQILHAQGQTLDAVLERFESVTGEFRARLAALPDEALHEPVREGAWSPAEYADHLVRANSAVSKVLAYARKRQARPELPPIVMARGEVTADGRPMAPEVVRPVAGRDRKELAFELEVCRLRLAEEAKATEAAGQLGAETHTHAFFGSMNGLECVQMAAWHTGHHARHLPENG